MNEILRFNTGRQYSPEGQKIEAQVIERDRDYWGPFMRVRFADTTRSIWGIATIHGGTLNQEDIMQAYDNGRYEDASPFFFD
jgi:hypothetical protein